MTIMTTVLTVFMFVKGHRRAAYFTAGVMIVHLARDDRHQAAGRPRPAAVAVPDRHPDARTRTRPGTPRRSTAFAGIVMVLVAMLRTPLRRAPRWSTWSPCSSSSLVCLDRVFLGRHYPSDVIGGVLLGAFFVLLGIAVYNPLPRSHAESAEPLPEVFQSERKLAVILNPIKVEDIGQFRAIVSAMARGGRLVDPDVALHDGRGPGHRHGRGGLGRGRRPGSRLRRRRHGPRGVRRARGHRHPGRDRAGRHRQPAGPQPRHPALHPRPRSTSR